MTGNATLLKYAGNKRRVMHRIASSFDWTGVTRYIEPFCGALGAAVNCQLPDTVIDVHLSDINWEVVNLHEQFVRVPERLELVANSWDAGEETYYSVRAWDRSPTWRIDHSPLDLAARTLYLNKRCFNGLYRVNRDGLFNVAWNKATRPKPICVTAGSLGPVATLLNRARLSCDDWRIALQRARSGDVVYCDPPYVDVSDPHREFRGYVGSFPWSEHVALRDAIVDVHERGAHVYVSNASCTATRELYSSFRVVDVEAVTRTISSDGAGRRPVVELLACLD